MAHQILRNAASGRPAARPDGAGQNTPPVSKADFIAQIDLFAKTRRIAVEIAVQDKKIRQPQLSGLMSPDEIGRLGGFDRLDAQRKALLLNTSEFYRDNPKADVALGVTVLTHIMSDNDAGINSLSEGSMAAILYRSREAVSRASAKEAAAGRIQKQGDPGKASRLSPVIPHAFACRNHVTWLAEALKGSCVEVITPTRDEVITPTCDDVRTGANLTCDDVAAEPVTTSSHNFTKVNSLVVEEERETPRARESSKAISLQEKVEEPQAALVFTAENLKRWNTTTHRWGHSPTASLANFAVDPRITGADLKTDITALSKGRRVDLAQTALDIVLGNMFAMTLDAPTAKSVIGYKAAKNYLAKEFAGKLNELEKQEHERLASAEVTQELSKITIGEAAAKAEIRVKGTETRTEGWNQAAKASAANRIAGPDSPRNSAPAADRFRDDDRKVLDVRGTWIDGRSANSVIDEVPGATVSMVHSGLRKAGSGLNSGLLEGYDLDLVRNPSVDSVLEWVKSYCLFEIHGTPKSRCGGEIAVFKAPKLDSLPDYLADYPAKSKLVCLSQAFVDRIVDRYPLDGAELGGIFKSLTAVLSVEPARYPGLQAEIESEFEAKAAAKYAHKLAMAEKAEQEVKDGELGIRRLEDRVGLTERFTAEICQIAGERAKDFGYAWDLVKYRIRNRPADWIRSKAILMAELLRQNMGHDAAARRAFSEAFGEVRT